MGRGIHEKQEWRFNDNILVYHQEAAPFITASSSVAERCEHCTNSNVPSPNSHLFTIRFSILVSLRLGASVLLSYSTAFLGIDLFYLWNPWGLCGYETM